jgi:hypothetical protein
MYSATFLLLFGVFSIAHFGVNANAAVSGLPITSTRTTTPSFVLPTTTVIPSIIVPASAAEIGHCEPLPYGHGPRTRIDTPLGFLTNNAFLSYAKTALTPRGYVRVYTNEHGSSVSDSYLRYDELNDYDSLDCARRCDETKGCKAFNIFFERTPALNVGPQCKTSLSSTTIKCALWGKELKGSDAKNVGYKRWDFWVVVAGSNAYNKIDGTARSAAGSSGRRWDFVAVWGLAAFVLVAGLSLMWV